MPQGATISSATLTVDILFISGSPNANVYGDDVDSAPGWSNPGSRVKEITKTTAVTNITPSSVGLYPISITGIVQELVDRAGWASGNHMRFGFFNNAQSDNDFAFAAFEHATRTEAQLEIEYEEAGDFSGIYLGDMQINAIKLGSDDIKAVYLGSTKVFEKA